MGIIKERVNTSFGKYIQEKGSSSTKNSKVSGKVFIVVGATPTGI